jgi:hypothetical protein
MTAAEAGLPVKPLAGNVAIAASDVPTGGATPPPPPAERKPDELESLINRLFGGGT